MARKPRIHFPGAVHHAVPRGNGGRDIFFAKRDRAKFHPLPQEGVEKFKHRIPAFCLMCNHVHLVIQVGEKPLFVIMQNVSFRYAVGEAYGIKGKDLAGAGKTRPASEARAAAALLVQDIDTLPIASLGQISSSRYIFSESDGKQDRCARKQEQ